MEYTRLLDYSAYYHDHPDVARAGRDALDHYLVSGWRENRKTTSDVDLARFVSEFRSAGHSPVVPAFVDFVAKALSGNDTRRENDVLARAALDALVAEPRSEHLSSTTKDMLARFPPPIHPYVFDKSPHRRPRITMVVPTMDDAAIYGGIKTALDFFEWLISECGSDLDYRLISQNDDKFGRHAQRFVDEMGFRIGNGSEDHGRQILHVRDRSSSKITLRDRETFVTTFWATSLPVQQGIKNCGNVGDDVKICNFLQDFEPNFYPANSAQVFSLRSLLDSRNVLFVSNSASLAEYVKITLSLPGPCLPFTPRLNSGLRPANGYSRENILLFYARKNPRNLLEIGNIALSIFVKKHPDIAGKFQFLGVGDVQGNTPLGGGNTLRCLGKLHLEEYRALLARARVGVSLMMAPHPSYPPLEMAYNGLRVVTNDFSSRHMEGVHSNISSSKSVDPEEIASLIHDQCIASMTEEAIVGAPFGGFMAGFEKSDNPFTELKNQEAFVNLFGGHLRSEI